MGEVGFRVLVGERACVRFATLLFHLFLVSAITRKAVPAPAISDAQGRAGCVTEVTPRPLPPVPKLVHASTPSASDTDGL